MTKTGSETVRAAFDAAAADYDALRRKLIPEFDSFYGVTLDLLEEALGDRSFSCMDLGIGTGLLSEMILKRFPRSTIEGVDFAPKMIETARMRLAHFGARVDFTVADYSLGPLRGPVDAVVSALSIHHLDHAAKRRLFRLVYEALAPGGIFINADQSLGGAPELEAAYQRRWEKDVQATGIGAAEFAAAGERTKLDRSATFADQIAWLEQAGFAYADIAWKRHRFTVFYAGK